MSVPPSYLLWLDFDGTMARTFDPSPNGIGVQEAYRIALPRLFGGEILSIYDAIGGLNNRAPSGLVDNLIEFEPSLRQVAMRRIVEEIPEVMELSLGRGEIALITEALVRFKLEILLGEITNSWPLPCEGFISFINIFEFLSGQGLHLEVGILTAGHHAFIRRVAQSWGIPCPRVMVTDDDTRWLDCPVDMRVKPAVLLFDMTMTICASLFGEVPRGNIIYFGDDINRDGRQADLCNIPFGHFGDGPVDHLPRGSFVFRDWTIVAEFLQDHADDFRRGLSCAEIFAQF